MQAYVTLRLPSSCPTDAVKAPERCRSS